MWHGNITTRSFRDERKIWERGYSSSCDLCTTLVNAIASLAVGFGRGALTLCGLNGDKVSEWSENSYTDLSNEVE